MANAKDNEFTKRAILVLAQQAADSKAAADQVFATVKALAKKHGIKMPKPIE